MAAPQGVCVAFDDVALEPDPLWTTLTNVVSYEINRSNDDEINKKNSGTATIHLVDTVGDFDPYNVGGAYYGLMDPMKQVAIAMQNPVDLTWTTLYRGFVSEWNYELDETESVLHVTIECVDAFDLLAASEVVPDGFATGVTQPDGSTGDVTYLDDQNVDDRIRAALTDAKWPTSLRTIFSGNVSCVGGTYSLFENVQAVIEEAADAEFPGGVSTWYVSKDGKVTFHGRFARFDPDGTAAGATPGAWNFTRWYAGDAAAVAFDPTVFAPVANSLAFTRGKDKLFNVATASPNEIADDDIQGQIVTDPTSIAQYGIRNVSFPNLITKRGLNDSNKALAETKLYAQYWVANYAYPKTRVPQVVFRSKDPSELNADVLWNLICGVEISDIVNLFTTHPWGGGINEDFYVEGIAYTVDGVAGDALDVTLTLNLSPVSYYEASPF